MKNLQTSVYRILVKDIKSATKTKRTNVPLTSKYTPFSSAISYIQINTHIVLYIDKINIFNMWLRNLGFRIGIFSKLNR